MIYQRFVPEGWKQEVNSMTLDEAKKYKEKGEILEGYVNKCDDNGNLFLNLGKEIYGFLPYGEVEAFKVEENGLPKLQMCKNKVNKIVQFKIKDINNNIVILSRKDVEKEVLKWLKIKKENNDILSGIVRSIQPYGAFIEIAGGVVGLIHIEDISVSRIKNPSERFEIGQKVNIVIKSIENNTNKIYLSHKELLGTWDENIKEIKKGRILKGIVKDRAKNNKGIFIEIKPNLVGMAEYSDKYNYGDKVNIFVKKIIPEKKKIKLAIVGGSNNG